MKTHFVSIVRKSTLPTLAAAALFGMFTAWMAAMSPTERGVRQLPDERPFTLSLADSAPAAVVDPSLPDVSFAMPVHFPVRQLRTTTFQPVRPASELEHRDDDAGRVLRAIAEVESRGNPRRVGRLGERGLYQFRRNTWNQHTREPFARAHHPEVSTTVARRHYHWLQRQLRQHGRQATTYEVALAWNAGVTSVLKGRVPASSHAYARRVVNLSANS